MTVAQKRDLWRLVQDQLQVDPDDLTEAIEDQIRRKDLDYRSRLLIRDSLDALQSFWGRSKLLQWLSQSALKQEIEAIWQDDYERVGFPTLRRRVMDTTRPEQVKQFLRELSLHVARPVTLEIGGSIALILPGLLVRKTDDMDIVNEVPAEIRSQHAVVDELAQRYALELAHFQSHYLPKGWQQRLHSQEPYGSLRIYLVDPYDVVLSKLFSARTKDLDDLRVVLPQLDKATLVRRLQDTTMDMLAAPGLREKAAKNWYILYGELLPT
jgi:hypothetical protein